MLRSTEITSANVRQALQELVKSLPADPAKTITVAHTPDGEVKISASWLLQDSGMCISIDYKQCF